MTTKVTYEFEKLCFPPLLWAIIIRVTDYSITDKNIRKFRLTRNTTIQFLSKIFPNSNFCSKSLFVNDNFNNRLDFSTDLTFCNAQKMPNFCYTIKKKPQKTNNNKNTTLLWGKRQAGMLQFCKNFPEYSDKTFSDCLPKLFLSSANISF